MRIGVDMLALQSPDSRLRGVGRYGRHFLGALLPLAREDSFVLYAHEGLPVDQFPDAENAEVRTLRIDSAAGERGIGDALERLVRTNPDRIDALLLINPFEQTPEYAPPARPLNGPAIVAVIYDLIPFIQQERYLGDPGHARRFYRHLERLRHYDRLLAISESTRVDGLGLLGLPDDRIVNVGAAADGRFFRPDRSFPIAGTARAALGRLGVRGPFVFSLAGMDDRKNLRGLIDAFALLPSGLRMRHQLVVTCAITEAYAAGIRDHAEQRGVADRLVLTGGVDDSALRILYQRCAAFVFPSLYEGFGLPILEAMHCGAPVVAGNNSSQGEVVGDAGLLANAEDPADIAARMALLLDDPESAESLRARAVEQARRFSWEATAARAHAAISGPDSNPAPTRVRVDRAHRARPRVAMFSPWPPKASGISDYSARLIRGLSEYYAIDLYHEPGYVPELGLQSGDYGCFDHRLFPRNDRAFGYHGVVHQMGNSFYHKFVYESMQRFPGVVVLHDFCLAGFQHWYAHVHQRPDPDAYLRGEVAYCYPDRHGEISPRLEEWSGEPGGFQEALARRGLHLNRRVFDSARAVIVHSPWCVEQARAIDPECAEKCAVIPLGSTAVVVPAEIRARTRARFGLPEEALIVGSFGILSNGKMNEEALAAFRELARENSGAIFLFVGQDWENGQAQRAAAELGLSDRVRFLGRQPAEEFEALLPVVDIGISLRRPPTYGETSAALLDLLRHGVPTIVNDVGTFADYPDSVTRKVRLDTEGIPGLVHALTELARDPDRRRSLGLAAHQYVARRHSWPLAASMYADLIERLRIAAPRPARRREVADRILVGS